MLGHSNLRGHQAYRMVCFQIKQLDGKVAGYNAVEWIEKLSIQMQWLTDRAVRVQQGLF